jgi:hypothetical protein
MVEGPSAARLKRVAALASDFPQSPTLQCALAYASALAGKPARARELSAAIEPMNALKKRSNAYGMALMAMALGNETEAIRWLEVSFSEGSLWSLALRSDPILNPLRDSPRFHVLMRRCAVESGVSPYPGHLELIARTG